MQWIIGILLNDKLDSLNTRADTPMHLAVAICTMITTMFSVKHSIQNYKTCYTKRFEVKRAGKQECSITRLFSCSFL